MGTIGVQNKDPHCPLKIHSGGRDFVGQDGRFCQMRIDAAWAALVQLTLAEWRTYLNARKAQGFNAVILTMFEVRFNSNTNANLGQTVGGLTPFTTTLAGGKPDMTTPRDSYWAHADQFLYEAKDRGFQVITFPTYLGFARTEGIYPIVVDNGSSRMSTYGSFYGNWVKRHLNALVAIGGDISQASGTPLEASVYGYLDDFCDAMRAVAGFRNLVTAHWFPPTTRSTAEAVPGGQDRGSWEDVNFVYKYDAIHQACEDAYAVSGPIACFLGETRYQGHNSNPTARDIRCQPWQAVTSGCRAGSGHGCEQVWGFGAGLYEDANPWTDHLNDSGAVHFKVWAAFMDTIAWQTLDPDTTSALVTAGRGTVGTLNYVTAAKDSTGTLALVYIRNGGAVTLDMGQFAGNVFADWVDPVNGALTAVTGSQPFANSGSKVFTPPGNNSGGDADLALWLRT